MGMYTLIKTDFILKPDTPQEIVGVLQAMAEGDWDRIETLKLDDPFFECERWKVLFTMGSAYFDEPTTQELTETLEGLHVKITANLKNYDNEIEKFAAWIRLYCLPQSAPFVISIYEETPDCPTKYYTDGAIKVTPFDWHKYEYGY